jgi:hypothetical protein
MPKSRLAIHVALAALIAVLTATALYRRRAEPVLAGYTHKAVLHTVKRWSVRKSGEQPTYLLVFQPTECSAALRLIASVNRISRGQQANVVGIVAAEPDEMPAVRRTLDDESLAFPLVRLDRITTIAFLSYYSTHRTPTVIQLNPDGSSRLLTVGQLVRSTGGR